MSKYYIALLSLSLSFINLSNGQVVINEMVPSNTSGYLNTTGAYDDWIELFNGGGSPVDLQGYGLTDDSLNKFKFKFPSQNLPNPGYILVFPTGKNNTLLVNHWETPVKATSSGWKYFAGTSQPDTNWRNPSFSDGGWTNAIASAHGGIGYGDGDDEAAQISLSSKSVMIRKTFFINASDTDQILKAVLNIDYDDGFVAYLNGYEIARANIGVPGDRPLYNDYASSTHEALGYQALGIDSCYINPTFLKSIIVAGNNVLAIEVHNESSSSNDLSAIPYLTFGIKNSSTIFTSSTPPSFFHAAVPENYSANFKLSKSGDKVFLYDAAGNQIDSKTYGAMQSNHSMGRCPNGSNLWRLIKIPTPKLINNSGSGCYDGYAADPIFSKTPGFYTSSQNVSLSTSTPGATIRYTTNGDDPTSSSDDYTSTLHLSNTVTIRAKTFAPNYLPSNTITNTYFIDEDLELPVFTVTTDSLNLWDYNTGIYVMGPNADPVYPYQGANFWQDWEKPASIEYYDKNKNRVFSFPANIKISGNYSQAKPQKSFEIKLDEKTANGNYKYSLYSNKPQVDDIGNFILRNSGTDWNKVHFRDPFMERVMKPTYSGYLAAEPVDMFLNGEYWGVYCIDENHDQHWMKNNFGLSRDEIDYLKEGGGSMYVNEGSDASFWTLYNYATTQSPSTQQYYDFVDTHLDLNNYADYFIAETYYNNGDWIGGWTNNIKLWRPKETGGKWRYMLYDLDFGLGLQNPVTDDRLEMARNPAAFSFSSEMFDKVLVNPTFKRYFINRYADLINTIFKPSQILSIMHQFQDSMSHDMDQHFAKWGSNQSTWQGYINSMTSFINARPAIQRNYIQSQFSLNQQVSLTFNTNPPGAGRIQISTVVPLQSEYPWTGVYFDGNPVTITAIPNPGFTFDHWSSNHGISDPDQTETFNFTHGTESILANFTGSAQTPQIVVSEFNYNSDSISDASDWLELHNYGSFSVDISGWKLKDQNDYNDFVFPVGTVLAPNGYLVVATNLNHFQSTYPGVTNVIGPLGFNLSNSTDEIRLFDPENQSILSFNYFDIAPWPTLSDGGGFTNELWSNTSDPNDGNSWHTGCIGGSPGRAYTSSLSSITHVTGSTTFCTGSNTTLSINSTSGYTYQWRRNGINISGANDTFYVANQGGAYSVSLSYQGCGGISDTLVASSVTSGQAPVVVSHYRCGEGTVDLTATSTDSIYWFDAPNGNILGTGNTFTTPTLTSTTTYYAQTSLSCPSAVVPATATVKLIPAIPAVIDQSICGPGPVVLNATDTATVKWYNEATNGALLYTGNVFVTGTIPHDSTFYAEAVSNSCSSDRVALNVTVTAATPPLTSNVSKCGPGSLVLTASSLAPIYWFDSIVGGNQISSGINFHTPFLTQTTVYYVESNNGCASLRVPVSAIIHDIPSPPIAADSARCGNGSLDLFATANFLIQWFSGPSGGTSLTTGSLFSTGTISQTTTYYVEDIDVCSSVRIPVVAIVNPLPQQPIGHNAIVCGAGIVNLSATSSNTVYWYDTPGGTLLGIGSTFSTPLINATTSYYAVAFDGNCMSTPATVTAVVTPGPTVFLGNDTSIASGTSLVLNAGSGFDSYLWSTNDTTQTITVNSTNTYSVQVSLNGCSGIDAIIVTVINGIQSIHTWNGYINVYPNPVKEKINLEVESKKSTNAEICIYDLTGKILIRKDIKLLNGLNTETLDMTSLAKGMYFMNLRTIENSITMSLIVE